LLPQLWVKLRSFLWGVAVPGRIERLAAGRRVLLEPRSERPKAVDHAGVAGYENAVWWVLWIIRGHGQSSW
jgi:hypothetical protein